MAAIEILVPSMGESIFDVSIIKWLKNEGDFVQEDETLVEIATDKVDSEIPSPVSGILQKIFIQNNSEAKVGSRIAVIQTEVENIAEIPEIVDYKLTPSAKKTETSEPEISNKETEIIADKFLSPLVREIAKQENISIQELNKIKGSGQNERITKFDLLNYIETQNKKSEPNQEIKNSIIVNSGDEIIEMNRMRKIIAENMMNSIKTSAHVTSFIEADATEMVLWREKNKDEYFQKYNSKLTFTPFFIQATVKVLKQFPLINSSIDGDKIIVKKNFNIGMATALPTGNLIVPVIKNAENLSFHELVYKINDLAERARINKLQADEISNGTFTITNLGTFGNLTGTPIINQPQVAILAIGVIAKKPAVISTQDGDFLGIRHKTILSLSFDHRIIDGAMGGMFLQSVVKKIENFDFQNCAIL
jgi:2-oxoglutarate dehydrogenase E2 component (dihydrolipoamide succinyltransferase)